MESDISLGKRASKQSDMHSELERRLSTYEGRRAVHQEDVSVGDLDIYRHVNNSNFWGYLVKGIEHLKRLTGMTDEKLAADFLTRLFLNRLVLKYKGQLEPGEKVVITTQITRVDAKNGTFSIEQLMKDSKDIPIAEAASYHTVEDYIPSPELGMGSHMDAISYMSDLEKGRADFQKDFGIDEFTLEEEGHGLWVRRSDIQLNRRVPPGQPVQRSHSFKGYRSSKIVQFERRLFLDDNEPFLEAASDHYFVTLP
ncbi:acyl-[acyl-carrier-protein] thioesterase, partial [Candidatus Woesearchaeota archaeon]|nr:acyl-[acyl-carrier-protein] thioesterase [Candidatus Woesearchaeota archaeon]